MFVVEKNLPTTDTERSSRLMSGQKRWLAVAVALVTKTRMSRLSCARSEVVAEDGNFFHIPQQKRKTGATKICEKGGRVKNSRKTLRKIRYIKELKGREAREVIKRFD